MNKILNKLKRVFGYILLFWGIALWLGFTINIIFFDSLFESFIKHHIIYAIGFCCFVALPMLVGSILLINEE